MENKILIGMQNSVMGFDDPFFSGFCDTHMRTGMTRIVKSQDPKPSINDYLTYLKKLNVDYLMQQVMPDNKAIEQFIEASQKYHFKFIMANEYGNANGPYNENCTRYDIDAGLVKKAVETGNCIGILYDESEHLQLHPGTYMYCHHKDYDKPYKYYHYANTTSNDITTIENEVAQTAKKITEKYNCPVYNENVFPVMYHTLSSGGFNPCPKILKEEFASLQLATAMGANWQYKRKLGICVDLWGPDEGNWFSRHFGFPGHSPTEFLSALKIGYHMAPDHMFVENIDILARYTDKKFVNTEYGEMFEYFTKEYVPTHKICYSYKDFMPETLIIRSDDSDINEHTNLYGCPSLQGNIHTQSIFRVFHLLSGGALPDNGLTYFLPQFVYHSIKDKNFLDDTSFPSEKCVDFTKETQSHHLYYPLKNVAVADHFIRTIPDYIKNIIVCGSRLTEDCRNAIMKGADDGKKIIITNHLSYGISNLDRKNVFRTENFSESTIKEQIAIIAGKLDSWQVRFRGHQIKIMKKDMYGMDLSVETEGIE